MPPDSPPESPNPSISSHDSVEVRISHLTRVAERSLQALNDSHQDQLATLRSTLELRDTEIEALRVELRELRDEWTSIQSSRSLALGRFLTSPFRVIGGLNERLRDRRRKSRRQRSGRGE